MEVITCEKNLNALFPREISLIIVEFAYWYDHLLWHHEGCNIRKFKNIKFPCNCLFRMNHIDECKFFKGFLSAEAGRENASTLVRVEQWAGTVRKICTCAVTVPKKIVCNTCFTQLKYCCGYNCVFCFMCDECGVGHPYVGLYNN